MDQVLLTILESFLLLLAMSADHITLTLLRSPTITKEDQFQASIRSEVLLGIILPFSKVLISIIYHSGFELMFEGNGRINPHSANKTAFQARRSILIVVE